MQEKKVKTKNNWERADFHSKEIIFQQAVRFFIKPSKSINKKDLREAKKILLEIQEWELEYGGKDFSVLKNNSILVSYLAYKFGELVGFTEKELSNLYISGLVKDIGKTYICDENKALAYEYLTSPLKSEDKGFEKISEALKLYPLKTREYLEKNTNFQTSIIDSAFNFHCVYSNLFKEKTQPGFSQSDTVLWFADSLSAVSFSSLEGLQRNYSKDRYISLVEGLELLREQTEDLAPEFWSKTSGLALMGVMLTMVVGFSNPSKSHATGYSSNEVISLVNEYREKKNLESLNPNEKLTQAAIARAQDMLKKDYWSHSGPSGESAWQFIEEEGYRYSMAGENLAKGYSNASKMNEDLINSVTHKENIVDPKFEDIGVAVIEGELQGKKVTLVVQLFANEEETVANEKTESKNQSVDLKNNLFLSFKNFLERIGLSLKKPNN